MRVHRPGEPGITARAELVPGREDDVRRVGKRGERGPVEQVAGDRLDAGGVEPLAHTGVAEAGDADDPPCRRCSLREAGERRPHLAGNAEDHEVAFDRRELVDQHLARQRQEVVERRARCEAVGQGRGIENGHEARRSSGSLAA
jgi:hypothetical protein